MPIRRPPRPIRRRAAFTLVEVMVVVVVIGLLAVMATQAIQKVQTNSRSSRVANDFRVFATAFTAYAQQFGTFPPTTLPGAIPAGMNQYLGTTNWKSPSAIGGYYFWVSNITFGSTHYNGVILIFSYNNSNLTTDTGQLTDIDKKIDDGDLSKGNFFMPTSSYVVYVVDK